MPFDGKRTCSTAVWQDFNHRARGGLAARSAVRGAARAGDTADLAHRVLEFRVKLHEMNRVAEF